MIGSEKQIKWATEIKDMFLNGKQLSPHHGYKGLVVVLAERKKRLEKSIAIINNPEKSEKMRNRRSANLESDKKEIAKISEYINKIKNEENASWFIDNRDNSRIINRLGSI